MKFSNYSINQNFLCEEDYLVIQNQYLSMNFIEAIMNLEFYLMILLYHLFLCLKIKLNLLFQGIIFHSFIYQVLINVLNDFF